MVIECKVSPTSAQTDKISESKENSNTKLEVPAQADPSSIGVYGMVKWYNCKYNYGFISRLDNKQDLFVHRNGIKKCNPKKFKSLMDGDVVMFDVYISEKGAEARNVTGPEGKPARPSRYAKFRPWYQDILKKNKAMSLEDKNDEKTERSDGRKIKERKNYQKDKNEKKNESEKIDKSCEKTNSKESPISTTPDITVATGEIDVGYSSKSTSENDKTKNYKPKKNFIRTPRTNRRNLVHDSQPHSCEMCVKERTQVEV
ncbi:hypothetical protein MXB_1275 [Myxobolus squamalis]|nr:hypothetical protein MXB_1275 [Myxobolus squamalis]